MTTEPGNYRYLRFTPFGAAAEGAWAKPAPRFVQGRAYFYANLHGSTVCGPHRIMTEGDYEWERKVKAHRPGSRKHGGRLLSVVDEESVARAQEEYEERNRIRISREHQVRWEREHAYERKVKQDEELERQRQRRLAQMEMGKQQALRAQELHELANSIRLGEITHDPAKFERWLIRKGIITKEESVTGIKDGTITTTKGASE